MDRFSKYITAQERTHQAALRELRNGHKVSHWSWWEIPQIVGLGLSPISQKYAIKDLAEARAYLENDVLRAHLLELCDALLSLETNDADEVMGFPDNLKLRSCMTLFAEADHGCAQFHAVLDKYFGGKKDRSTLEILQPPRQNCREIEDWS
jgi:uncharacterized protein (DUF1810 family)